jgi:hypothetical protein
MKPRKHYKKEMPAEMMELIKNLSFKRYSTRTIAKIINRSHTWVAYTLRELSTGKI